MKKIFKLFCVLTIFAGVTSCDEYLDVNKDPNNPLVSELTPEDMLAASQNSLATTLNGRMNQLGNIMVNSWSANGSDFADPFGNEFRYNITNTFYSDIWSNLYVRTANLTHIENYNDGANWDNHKAVAKILKAFSFQYIVDLYGDSPYSDIHQGTDLLFPSYDDDQVTYRSLVTLLDEAIALIDNVDALTVTPFGGADVMLQGDMVQWKRFANTIKLRLLVRQTTLANSADPLAAETQTYITNEFNDMQTEGAQFLTTNVSINPGYLNSDGKQNPFFSSYGSNPLGVTTTGYRTVGPSEQSAEFLDGTAPGTTSDPRAFRLWKTRGEDPGVDSPGALTGIVQGASGRPSTLGLGVLSSSEQSSNIMLAAESYLLQAEAIQGGYMAGSMQTMFDNAIDASFNHLGAGDATAYKAAISTLPGLGLGNGTDSESIARQKWIALTSTNGIELFIEYNRTGMPAGLLTPSTSTTPTGDRPVRLMYPSSEYSGNSNNVISQTTADAFTSKVFWDAN